MELRCKCGCEWLFLYVGTVVIWGLVRVLPPPVTSHPSLTKQLKRGSFPRVYCVNVIMQDIDPAELLVHGPAVSLILIGWDHFVHVDPDRGQDAMQSFHGLLGQGGLSAHDPGQLCAEGAELRAAVDQSVTFIVCGQHPVGTGGRRCRGGGRSEL